MNNISNITKGSPPTMPPEALHTNLNNCTSSEREWLCINIKWIGRSQLGLLQGRKQQADYILFSEFSPNVCRSFYLSQCAESAPPQQRADERRDWACCSGCVSDGRSHGVEYAPIRGAVAVLNRLDETVCHCSSRCDPRESLLITHPEPLSFRILNHKITKSYKNTTK